jgi:hypothetical protein
MAKGRAVAIVLDDVEKRELTALTRKHGAPQALAERARIGGIERAQQQGDRCQDQCLRCDGWHVPAVIEIAAAELSQALPAG